MCAVVCLRALMARQAARLITNPPIATQLFQFTKLTIHMFISTGFSYTIATQSLRIALEWTNFAELFFFVVGIKYLRVRRLI
jgi:hypothetical protein